MSNETTHESRGWMRRLARWLVKRYYPNIEITGADRIPQSGPVLLCANHANSLLDAVMIGIVAHRPVRFMARAPLFDHPVLGPIKLANHPIHYSETPAAIRSVAPDLGQHTEEILLEIGYDWERITELQDKGVIL